MNVVDRSFNLRSEIRRLVLGWFHPSTLAFEKTRAELNEELRAHWKPNSIDVYELIQENWEADPEQTGSANPGSKDTRFIVFIDPSFDVDWISMADLESRTEHCVSIAESIGAKRCKHLPCEQLLEFRRIIGHAIVAGICGDSEQSCKLSDSAALFLKERTIERSRSWTLSYAHALILGFSAALAPFYLHDTLFGSSKTFPLILSAIQGGVIGAYLSVIQKAGRGEWDAAAGRGLHLLEVFTKLFAGALLGGIAFGFSQSIDAPPSLKGIVPDVYSAFILGLVAGFFERMIPKMISNYSETKTSDS